MSTKGFSRSSSSLCRYENGEMKSKYQSAVRIGQLPSFVDRIPHGEPCGRIEPDPRANLVERAVAADAESGRGIDRADADARARHLAARSDDTRAAGIFLPSAAAHRCPRASTLVRTGGAHPAGF